MSVQVAGTDALRDRRALVVVAHDYGRQQSAATSRYRALAKCAGAAGWPVTFLTETGFRDPEAALIPIGASLENKRSLIARGIGEVIRGLRMGFQVPREGVVVVAIPAYFTGLVIATILRLRQRPYRLDVRDIYPDVLVTSGVLAHAPLITRALDRWTRWVFRGAEGITAATAGIARQVEERIAGVRPVLLVRNGFGGRFIPAPELRARTPLIVTHGTLGRFQNSDLLADVILEARRQQLDWQFLVIGDGPTAHELDRANGPTLHRVRHLAQEDLPAALAPGWVGLSLRTNDAISADSIPVRMLEYIGLGIPVLVHPRSEGGDEIERNGCGVVVERADAETVVARLKELVLPEAQSTFRERLLARRSVYAAEAQWGEFFSSL